MEYNHYATIVFGVFLIIYGGILFFTKLGINQTNVEKQQQRRNSLKIFK
jgi:hypothetical protein